MSSDLPKIVMFPELGPDIGVQFLFKDCVRLQDEFGDNWLDEGFKKLSSYRAPVMGSFLSAGGKKGGNPHEIDLETLVNKLGWEEVASRIMDAICWSVRRKSFKDHQEEMLKAAFGDDVPPQKRPATSSRKSGERATEQDFSGHLL
jgi:hypothetical protein